MPEFRIKRIYDDPSPDDGVRLLVDRLWPRGVSKASAQIHVWAKDLTPSHELRKWFHSHPDQHKEFARKYLVELQERHDELTGLLDQVEAATVTLVTATKDFDRGHVAVLKKFLETHT